MKVHNERTTLIAVAVIVLGGGVAGLLLRNRGAIPDTAAELAAVPANRAPGAAPAALTATVARSVAAVSADEIDELAAATMSGPRESRLAAIEKLSKAPRDRAIEPLKRVLLNGEPGVDRPAALLALRELALAQGDGDERIRNAVREVIYHGDDETLAADAQDTLDVISGMDSR